LICQGAVNSTLFSTVTGKNFDPTVIFRLINFIRMDEPNINIFNNPAADIVGKRRRGRPRKYQEGMNSTHPPSRRSLSRIQAAEPLPLALPSAPPAYTASPDYAGAVSHTPAHSSECPSRQIDQPQLLSALADLENMPMGLFNKDETCFNRSQYTDRDIASVLSSISASIDKSAELTFRGDSIQALIRTVQLQDQIIQRIPRCLICLEPHNMPVVSTVCWHVFCESCWLQSLASKRICPHCSSITSPEDLRRLYL
jgi:hypothetical protein